MTTGGPVNLAIDPSAVPPPLAYADVSTQFGLIVERRLSGLTITVPTRLWYRRPWVVGLAALVILGQILPALYSAWQAGLWIGLILTAFAVISTTFAVGVLVAMRRLQAPGPSVRRFAARFDVEGETLAVRWWVPRQDDHEQHFSCGRNEIVSIRGDLYAMGLTIRVRGKAIHELLHDRPKVVRVWIAAALREALNLPHDKASRAAEGA